MGGVGLVSGDGSSFLTVGNYLLKILWQCSMRVDYSATKFPYASLERFVQHFSPP